MIDSVRLSDKREKKLSDFLQRGFFLFHPFISDLFLDSKRKAVLLRSPIRLLIRVTDSSFAGLTLLTQKETIGRRFSMFSSTISSSKPSDRFSFELVPCLETNPLAILKTSLFLDIENALMLLSSSFFEPPISLNIRLKNMFF